VAIYRYDSGSLLDEVRLIKNSAGGVRALLHARTDASPEQLSSIQQHLIQQGLKAVPIFEEGKHYLEVRGLKNPEDFNALLASNGWVQGASQTTQLKEDVPTKGERLRSSTLKLAGFAYNAGDASYLYYKGMPLIEKWHTFPKDEKFGGKFFGILDVVAGVGYALGSLCLTFFGSRDQSVNTITTATKKIERYTRKEGYAPDQDGSLAAINHEPKRGVIGRIKHTIERYPSEALNSIYVFVGLFLSAAALYHGTRPLKPGLVGEELKKAKQARLWDRIDVGLGVVTATSAITGIVVKEHKRDEDQPKRHGIGGFVDWIREKPLRATGYGYMIATGFHAVATWGKWKDKSEEKRFLIGRVIFIAANVVSELLLAVSSKGHGVGVKPDSSVDTSIIAATAETIAKQNPAQHEAMIHQLAGYMSSPEVLGGKADAIAAELRTQVASMKSNPWAAHKLPASAPVMVAEAAPEQPHEEKPSTKVSHVDHASHQKHQVSHAHHDVEHKAESSHTAQGDSWQDHAQHTKQHAHTAAASV
jgi:hypothetical protein